MNSCNWTDDGKPPDCAMAAGSLWRPRHVAVRFRDFCI